MKVSPEIGGNIIYLRNVSPETGGNIIYLMKISPVVQKRAEISFT
jgi:hypothetical protein